MILYYITTSVLISVIQWLFQDTRQSDMRPQRKPSIVSDLPPVTVAKNEY